MPPASDDPKDVPVNAPRDAATNPAPPHRILRLADQQGRKAIDFVVEPDMPGRAAVAQVLDIPAVRKLRFVGQLIPTGRRDWRLEAELGATVVQECVVTLAAVNTRIDENVIRNYLSDLPPPSPGEVEMPADDTVEALPATLDLAAVMIEALSLALPPYPRAPGAGLGEVTVSAPGVVPLDADAVRPFAGLRDALARKDDDETT